MQVIILPTPQDVSRVAAERISAVLLAKPEANLGLATGSSPTGIYEQLKESVVDGSISLSRARGFALDEYVGIPPEHPQSYLRVIDEEVTKPLGLDPRRVHVPNGRAEDLDEAARQYERVIHGAGGIDIQILGIGENGHIGFNEPISSFASRTRTKRLSRSTLEANARFFESLDQVPTHALTQGIGTILDARELLLVAQGHRKAKAVAAAIEGPLTARIPASALQLHQKVTVVLDEHAAGLLELSDLYMRRDGALD